MPPITTNTDPQEHKPKTAWTPGPWEVGHTRFRTHRSVYASGRPGSLIAEVNAITSEQDPTDANARLIAAAPQLYALAENLQRWLMKDVEPSHISADDMRVYHLDGGVLSNLLNEARAALAQARGERA